MLCWQTRSQLCKKNQPYSPFSRTSFWKIMNKLNNMTPFIYWANDFYQYWFLYFSPQCHHVWFRRSWVSQSSSASYLVISHFLNFTIFHNKSFCFYGMSDVILSILFLNLEAIRRVSEEHLLNHLIKHCFCQLNCCVTLSFSRRRWGAGRGRWDWCWTVLI